MNPKLQLNINPIINRVYLKYLQCNTRVQIFFGGSSSGKSYFLAQRTVIDVLTGGRNYLICRAVANTIKKSVFNEIKKAITNLGLSKLFKINESDMTITCLNGYQILFCGLDDPEKIKSITPAFGVITDIWIEEATETNYKAYKQLNKRLRGKIDINKRIILSFNPVYKQHWIYKQFFINWDESKTVYQDEKLLILKTTYRNNKFLSDDDIYELENETDKYYYEVYTLGNWGVIGNVIFKNWEQRDLSEERKAFDQLISGVDFGFTNPNAYLKMHYNRDKKILYILDEVYLSGITNDILLDEINRYYEKELIIADNEDPQTIKELFKGGLRIVGAKKGKGSVEYGYKWLKKQKIIVDIKCQGTIKELSIHKNKEDKDGNPLNVPEDKDNHAISAMRYGMQDYMKDSVGCGVY